MYPRVVINLNKIKNNTKTIVKLCKHNNICVVGVTKVFGAIHEIVDQMILGGIDIIGDSRIENLKELKRYNIPKLLLRLPMLSEISEVIEYSDISLNSQFSTIKKLSEVAKKQNKMHKIILMIDLGDLREGIFEEKLIYATIEKILLLSNIELIGIGTNLTCYGGVLPDYNNLSKLVKLKKNINMQFNIDISVVSGGNSSSLYLLENNQMPAEVNQLRLGESIILGRETAFGNKIKDTYQDAIIMQCQIIEIFEKPSIPIGNIGMDAFGNKPSFSDNGIRTRALCAIGKQDVDIDDIKPVDKDINIIGASSDHLIIDITEINNKLKIGDIVDFNLNYGGVLSLFTSKYVKKLFI